MRNIKVLGLTVQKLLAWLKFKKKKKVKLQGHRVKNVGTHGKVLSKKYTCELSKF